MAERLFKLVSDFKPTGDQPEAIDAIVKGLNGGANRLVLQGVTGSGKTFTMANVIARWNRPTLILSHNKTLAAQLFAELRQFFPENAVEYFISYYDYYQPEAYIPRLTPTSRRMPRSTRRSNATASPPRTRSSPAAT